MISKPAPVDFLNNRSVSTKVFILLLLPFLALLIITSVFITEKHRHFISARDTRELMEVSIGISELILSLQKERGLSEGFIGSRGSKFTQTLKKQRFETDAASANLKQSFTKDNANERLQQFYKGWQSFLEVYKSLETNRQEVDNLSENENSFEHYSLLIKLILDLFQHSFQIDDVYLLQAIKSYNTIQFYTENAGQERALINKFLSSGRLNGVRYDKLATIIENQQALQNELKMLVSAKFYLEFEEIAVMPVIWQVEKVRQELLYEKEKHRLISNLRQAINTDNARFSLNAEIPQAKDPHRLASDAMAAEALELIRGYKRINNLNEDEKNTLNVLEKSLDSFWADLHSVSKLRAKGLPQETKLAKGLQQHETTILTLLNQLEKQHQMSSPEEWYRLATHRISLIDQIRQRIQSDIVRYVEDQERNSLISMGSYLGLSLLLFSVSLMIGLVIARKLAFGTREIVNKLRYLETSGDFSTRIAIEGNDEFAAIGQAINQHLQQLQRSFDHITHLMEQIAIQRYYARVSEGLPGDLGKLQEGINQSVKNIELAHNEKNQAIISLKEAKADAEGARRIAEANAEQVRLILDTVLDAIVMINKNGNILSFNPAAQKMFGFSLTEVLGKNVTILMPESKKQAHSDGLERCVKGQTGKYLRSTVEETACRKDGSSFPIELTVNSMPLGNDTGFTAVISDITDRKKRQAKIERMAMTDQLTGLANRHFFEIKLDEAIKQAQRNNGTVVLMLLDLDGLKTINDTLGHPEGDKVIKLAGDIFRKNCRETDTIARIGGDEFAIIISNPESESAVTTAAKRIIKLLYRQVGTDGTTIQMGVSVGICFYPDRSRNKSSLIKHTDEALYIAKKNGGNQYYQYDK